MRDKPSQFPNWLRAKIKVSSLQKMERFLKECDLNTVCQSALCPNRGECFRRGVATFMILGNICTRNCRFCAVKKGKPKSSDPEEFKRVAQTVKKLKLKHVVITSVTRDDLSDGGAEYFVRTIKKIREINFNTTIEVLIPDFQGKEESIKKIIRAKPEVINHNLETVPRLYTEVRPLADYQTSLSILKKVKQNTPHITTKSGLMLGLGETPQEIEEVMDDLRKVNCDIITLGQYLAPTKEHFPIQEFIIPAVFKKYKKLALNKGFRYVVAGPLVRSSYHADKFLL